MGKSRCVLAHMRSSYGRRVCHWGRLERWRIYRLLVPLFEGEVRAISAEKAAILGACGITCESASGVALRNGRVKRPCAFVCFLGLRRIKSSFHRFISTFEGVCEDLFCERRHFGSRIGTSSFPNLVVFFGPKGVVDCGGISCCLEFN